MCIVRLIIILIYTEKCHRGSSHHNYADARRSRQHARPRSRLLYMSARMVYIRPSDEQKCCFGVYNAAVPMFVV